MPVIQFETTPQDEKTIQNLMSSGDFRDMDHLIQVALDLFEKKMKEGWLPVKNPESKD